MNHNVVLRILSKEATNLQELVCLYKFLKAEAWAGAVPNSTAGQDYYDSYKHYRMLLLTYKKQLRQVNAAIKSIKQSRKKQKEEHVEPTLIQKLVEKVMF